ncbi:MAG: hypothetical protein ACRDCE_05600 [Cetobacterium sp.]|uniref:hypothetical protein n=1 Tax=Cetobacterium sp. TaxID=2071632 RepID=UPI003EE69C81
MTPCEELGYKVGDKFIVETFVSGFVEGQTVTLYRDFGTDIPLFKGDNEHYSLCDGEPGAYIHVNLITPVDDGGHDA